MTAGFNPFPGFVLLKALVVARREVENSFDFVEGESVANGGVERSPCETFVGLVQQQHDRPAVFGESMAESSRVCADAAVAEDAFVFGGDEDGNAVAEVEVVFELGAGDAGGGVRRFEVSHGTIAVCFFKDNWGGRAPTSNALCNLIGIDARLSQALG